MQASDSRQQAPGARRIAARVAAAVALAAALGPDVARATDVGATSTADVLARSRYVVVAVCTRVDVEPVAAVGGALFTFSHFRVETNVAGDLAREFTLRLLGGARDGVSIDAPLVPRFRVGERVVLLLGHENRDGHPIVSPHGVFRTRAGDGAGGDAIVETPIVGLELVGAGDGRASAGPPTVAEFVRALRRRFARGAGGGAPS